MEFRQIGPLQVSLVGLGCNQIGTKLGLEDARAVVLAALDEGINFFDTADSYGSGESERLLGEALAPHRQRVVLATKFGSAVGDSPGGARPEYVRQAVAASLKRLNTTWIDLYQLHRPDPSVPIAETLGVLGELVNSGMVRAIGHSNFSGPEIEYAAAAARPAAVFVSAQNEWSLVERGVEDKVLPAARAHGLGMIPYYPLASGVLSGKYGLGEPVDPTWRLGPPNARRRTQRLDPEVLTTVENLKNYAGREGHSILELAFSWLGSHGEVRTIIAGSTKPEQVRSNAQAARWKLTSAQKAEVDELTAHRKKPPLRTPSVRSETT